MHTRTQSKNILGTGLCCLIVLLLIIPVGEFPYKPIFSLNPRSNNLVIGKALHPKPGKDAITTQTVTVTNLSDTVNGVTSSILNLIANPGPDGVSFREALEASNNTPGEKIIEFDFNLVGESIFILSGNGSWPVLTSGDLTIQGDIDLDGDPDITLDGSLGNPDSPTANALSIWSDNNTISGLVFKHFSGGAILFGVPNVYSGTSMTISGNRIVGNTIEDSGISVSPFGWADFNDPTLVSNLTWQDTLISGNYLVSTMNYVGGIALIAAGSTANRNRILEATITDNTLIGYGVGIMVIAADTNSLWSGIPYPIRYADNNLIQGINISNNVIESVKYKGIEIGAGNMGNSSNQVMDVIVSGNQISGVGVSNDTNGITIFTAGDGYIADRMTANNRIAGVDVFGNRIEDTLTGIFARASDTNFTEQSPGYTGNLLENLTITDNVVLRSRACGICLWGSRSKIDILNFENVVTNVTIQGNEVLTSTEPWWSSGIFVIGGKAESICLACVSGNILEDLSVIDNEVEGFQFGLHLVGGEGDGAEYNRVSGYIHGNHYKDNNIPLEVVANSLWAKNNQIDIQGFFYLYQPLIGRKTRP